MSYFLKWLIILLCGIALLIAVGIHVISYNLGVIGWAILAFLGAIIAVIIAWLKDANRINKKNP